MLGLLLPILGMAFLLGLKHATDPDHVVAVTAVAAGERGVRQAGWIGALWGLGHTTTILVVGAAIIVAKVAIPARVGLSLEFAVAVMLVVLGALNLVGGRGAGAARAPSMPPFLVGVVHGLAGSAGATLLVLTLIPNSRWALGALAVFCAGTIGGMTTMTAAIAAPAAYAAGRTARVQRLTRVASGALSVCFGLYLAHRIGFVDGLFTGDPRWTPE